jgi:hypothetical protein
VVHLVCFVHRVGLLQPNKRNKPNKPNNGLLTPVVSFYNLLQCRAKYADIHAVTGIDFPTEFQGTPFLK